jgi:LacI family transcriptional regulator
MSRKNITIHDIAEMLGVSSSTVSRALNDNPRISLATREAVQKIAREHGYRPNNIATSLRKGRSMTIGVVIPRINRFFFSGVISGMEEILNGAGYNLMISQSLETQSKEIQGIKSFLDMRADAIFLSLAADCKNTTHIRELISKGMNIVMFDRVDEKLGVSTVKLDDYSGAKETVLHMIKQGYRKIFHVAGPANLSIYYDRLQGYLDALKEAGIASAFQMIIPDTLTREKSFTIFSNILAGTSRPDAVFAASDFSALGALLAARDLKLSIPQDFGIAGFANEPFTEFVQPGLTTTDQNAEEMGRKVASLYLDNMDNPDVRHEIIKPKLMVRGSTLREN